MADGILAMTAQSGYTLGPGRLQNASVNLCPLILISPKGASSTDQCFG